MDPHAVENINIEPPEILITPSELKQAIPLSEKARATIAQGRSAIEDILERKDHRIIVVVGPCSIHDLEAANEYALRLKALADKVSDSHNICSFMKIIAHFISHGYIRNTKYCQSDIKQ